MLPVHIALVSWTRRTDPRDLSHVAAALQKQAIRDLAPIWNVAATVDVFPTLRSVPAGYWPVVIVDDVKGAAGYHQDSHGQPYALVEYSRSWSLTASHEVLEMLCDPRGTVGARYSFTGAVTRPRHILAGGYVSWWDPQTNHVWQQVWFGPKREFLDLGEGGFASGMSLREFVDVNSQHPGIDTGLDESDEMLADAREAWHGANATADARGARLEEELARWAAG